MVLKIFDKLFSSRRKKKNNSQSIKPKKTWEELKRSYNAERMLLSFELNQNLGNLPEGADKDLKKIEEELIALMPSDFDQSVFQIFARHDFDIIDLYESDWREMLKTFLEKNCHFLYSGTVYSFEDVPWEPLPILGEDLFLHLLKLGQEGEADNSIDRISSIFEKMNFKKIIEEKKLLGHDISEEEARSLGGRLIAIFMSRECSKQSSAIIDIFCEVEGGEQFVKKILNELKELKE